MPFVGDFEISVPPDLRGVRFLVGGFTLRDGEAVEPLQRFWYFDGHRDWRRWMKNPLGKLASPERLRAGQDELRRARAIRNDIFVRLYCPIAGRFGSSVVFFLLADLSPTRDVGVTPSSSPDQFHHVQL